MPVQVWAGLVKSVYFCVIHGVKEWVVHWRNLSVSVHQCLFPVDHVQYVFVDVSTFWLLSGRQDELLIRIWIVMIFSDWGPILTSCLSFILFTATRDTTLFVIWWLPNWFHAIAAHVCFVGDVSARCLRYWYFTLTMSWTDSIFHSRCHGLDVVVFDDYLTWKYLFSSRDSADPDGT